MALLTARRARQRDDRRGPRGRAGRERRRATEGWDDRRAAHRTRTLTLMTDRTTDHVRVLSDLSGHVVDALLDDADDGSERDAFSDALRAYRSEGAPELAAPWRLPTFLGGARVAAVLRRLTRDLLHDASMPPAETPPAELAAETPPPNVRPIADARDIPALELASDGTWRPSGSALA